jgi:hypothetical protein
MHYELRSWYEDRDCLYTDDPRVRDLATRSTELQVVSAYFRSRQARQPFAWDIVGAPEVLAGISRQFRATPSARRR